jgi:hypothetical protein
LAEVYGREKAEYITAPMGYGYGAEHTGLFGAA